MHRCHSTAQTAARYPNHSGTRGIGLSADAATVIIADDGPGISAHAAASLFERFRRGPNASGPGAGLAIAKCIMERQGGHLSLDTKAARGACFVMEFRVAENPGDARQRLRAVIPL
ncbi:sensor histidine kinase [Steroidobacter sp.]|uniref:sensor histidine kinase n=1 Tax=Steroidobacter sp. TaxID=1978227 RepID=UPI0039C97DFA